jgi:hypothetical protein
MTTTQKSDRRGTASADSGQQPERRTRLDSCARDSSSRRLGAGTVVPNLARPAIATKFLRLFPSTEHGSRDTGHGTRTKNLTSSAPRAVLLRTLQRLARSTSAPYFPRLGLSFISRITGHGSRNTSQESRFIRPSLPLTLPPRQHTIPRVRKNRRDPTSPLGATE